jgi:adenosylcobyric acid synthase
LPARVLMVQGTASHVGKSWLVAGLCRLLRQDGWRVAPFKAQNMSNNAAAVPGGGEIGRAQALQAEAAGIAPCVDLNPVLLKPTGEGRSQVILHGRPVGVWDARGYYREMQRPAWDAIRASLGRLRAAHQVVVAEGAGSPAEVNLREHDLANMAVAELADAPVILVADIDRGGVFAALLGTLSLLPPRERERVRGLVVNRFRGDLRLFQDGVRFLEARSGVPVLGVLPWLDLHLDEEDGVVLTSRRPLPQSEPEPVDAVDVAVVRLPRISNFTDLDPLVAVPGVRLRYAVRPGDLAGADAVILPGSKNTLADLDWLREGGWPEALAAAPEVAGLCGGLQMLGGRLEDPLGVEDPGRARTEAGLGLLDAVTVFRAGKRARPAEVVVSGGPPFLRGLLGRRLRGYEIHAGETVLGPGAQSFLDGVGSAARPDGRVWGTYLHGLFDDEAVCRAWLDSLRARRGLPPLPAGAVQSAVLHRSHALDELAAALRRHLDVGDIYRLAGLGSPPG